MPARMGAAGFSSSLYSVEAQTKDPPGIYINFYMPAVSGFCKWAGLSSPSITSGGMASEALDGVFSLPRYSFTIYTVVNQSPVESSRYCKGSMCKEDSLVSNIQLNCVMVLIE